MIRRALALVAGLLLAACSSGGDVNPVPERLTEAVPIPRQSSVVAVPLSAPLAELERIVNRLVPQQLAQIDEQQRVCIPAQRVTVCLRHAEPCQGEACRDVPCKLGFKRAKVTPDISCRIVGEVQRGRITISGRGEDIRLHMPISAEIQARDVGHMLTETATAAAEVRAHVRLGVAADWQPTAKVDIDYEWTERPGIQLLGRRFTFGGKADAKLAPVIARLERELPGELRKLHLHRELETAWEQAFTSLELNAQNPPVWLRVTPQRLSHGGYRIRNDRLVLRLGMEAWTETFIGEKPADPEPTPLPPAEPLGDITGFRFELPVIAAYDQLVPVLARALQRLAAEPIAVPQLGDVRVNFGQPIIYATTGDRLAIGLPITARTKRWSLKTRGTVWLTGKPVNAPDSQLIVVEDLRIAGEADDFKGRLLLDIARAPVVLAEVQQALTQDFSGDFQKLRDKIDQALRDKRLGDVVLNVIIRDVEHGTVHPLAQGVFLPVEARGVAAIRYAPRG